MPNLDGTIAPLPAASVGLEDSQLLKALSAVSRIGQKLEPAAVAAPAVRVAAPGPVAAPAVSALPAPVAVAEPVSPPLAAAQARSDTEQPERTADPIQEFLLGVDASAPVRSTRLVRRSSKRPAELKIAAVVLAATAIFVAGFLAGRAGRRGGPSAPSNNATSSPRVDGTAVGAVTTADDAAAEAVALVGVHGRVLYRSASGPARPDGGVRVLALPVERPDGLPLETSGFRAGAVPTDRDRAAEALRAAGGDYAIADAEGRYGLRLAGGKYDVLFLSRHQPRAAAQPLPSEIESLLSAYFDQPAGLVGNIAVEQRKVDFDGDATAVDCEFSR